MSKVTCISKPAKFKNLTLNKEYDNVVVEDEAVIISNDSGFRARYAKKYFRVQPEAPVAPPAPVVRNLLDELTVEFDSEDGRLDLTLNRTTRTIHLILDNSTISCGIDEISNISSLKDIITEMYNNKVAAITGTREEFFRAVITKVLETLRDEQSRAYWLMSDNNRATHSDVYDAVLSELSIGHCTKVSPTSNNTITLWIFE